MATDKVLTFVGPLGPPVTGASAVTRGVLDRVERDQLQFGVGVRVIPFQRPHGAGLLTKVRLRLTDSVRITSSVLRRSIGLYLSMPGGSAVLGFVPAVVVSRLRRTPIYLHHHSFAYLENRSTVFAIFFRIAGPEATHVVLCGRMEQRLRAVYGDTPCIVLSNLAFVPAAASVLVEQGRMIGMPVVLGHFSNLTREKGLDTVLGAARVLARKGIRFRLLLAGPATNPDAQNLIDQALAESPNIEWLGPLDESQKSNYFSQLDLLLFPSRYKNEAQPMVVLEAAAYGVPTLGTGVGCLPDELSVRQLADGEGLAQAVIDFPWVEFDKASLSARTTSEIERWDGELDQLVSALMCR